MNPDLALRTLQVASLITILLFSSAARADADRLYQESLIRARLGDFGVALKLLRKARRKARGELLAKVHLQTGVVLVVVRKKKKARRSFRRALQLDPTLTLDPALVKGSAVRLFNKVRARLKGTLNVTADHKGAEVSLGGKPLGRAPLTAPVVIGRYELVIQTPDRLHRHSASVVIKSGEQLAVNARLAFVGGRITVISLPSGAEVTIDGKVTGKTPLKNLALTAGEHRLTVALDGRKQHTQALTLQPGKAITVAATLEPLASSPPTPPPAPASAPAAPPTRPPGVTPSTTSPPSTPTPSRRFPLWTVVTGGAALACVGLGLGMGAAASSTYDEYEATLDQTRYDELRADIETYDAVMVASFAAAGALAVTSAVLYLLVERRPAGPGTEAPRARVTPLIAPTSAGLRVDF